MLVVVAWRGTTDAKSPDANRYYAGNICFPSPMAVPIATQILMTYRKRTPAPCASRSSGAG